MVNFPAMVTFFFEEPVKNQNCLDWILYSPELPHVCWSEMSNSPFLSEKKNLSFGEIPGVLFRRRPLGFRTVQGDRIGSHRNLTNWSMRLLDQRSNKQQMKSPGFFGVWKDDLIDQKWRDVHFAQGGLQFYEMRRWKNLWWGNLRIIDAVSYWDKSPTVCAWRCQEFGHLPQNWELVGPKSHSEFVEAYLRWCLYPSTTENLQKWWVH